MPDHYDECARKLVDLEDEAAGVLDDCLFYRRESAAAKTVRDIQKFEAELHIRRVELAALRSAMCELRYERDTTDAGVRTIHRNGRVRDSAFFGARSYPFRDAMLKAKLDRRLAEHAARPVAQAAE